MTSTESGVKTIATVLAALLAIPLVIMAVMMPLMVIAKGGQMMGAGGGLGMFMPILSLAILSVVVYFLYTYSRHSNEGRQKTDNSLEVLRAAYARGDLSDEEFETRRARLRSQLRGSDEGEVSDYE